MIQGTQTEPQINEQKGENFEKEVNFWRLFDKWFFGQSKKEDPFRNQGAWQRATQSIKGARESIFKVHPTLIALQVRFFFSKCILILLDSNL